MGALHLVRPQHHGRLTIKELLELLSPDWYDEVEGRVLEMREAFRDTIRCGIEPLVRFAWGLHRDLPAVMAAAATGWSNGQVEGQINRLKTLKRQMYGRASFALLRARVLPCTAAPNPP